MCNSYVKLPEGIVYDHVYNSKLRHSREVTIDSLLYRFASRATLWGALVHRLGVVFRGKQRWKQSEFKHQKWVVGYGWKEFHWKMRWEMRIVENCTMFWLFWAGNCHLFGGFDVSILGVVCRVHLPHQASWRSILTSISSSQRTGPWFWKAVEPGIQREDRQRLARKLAHVGQWFGDVWSIPMMIT